MTRLARFFVAAGIPGPGRLQLEGDAAAHLGRVLRARPGQDIVIFDGRGGEYAARVETVTRKRVEVDVGAHDAVERESLVPLTLLQGLCRGERMDLVVRKATELGVARIRPVLAERSVVKLTGAREEGRLAHWQAVAVSACEQCGRNRVPEVLAPLPLAEALAAHGGVPGALLDPEAPAGVEALPPPGEEGLALLVGPEGGLTQAEREMATGAGYRGVRIGPRVLRTETAALVGVALLQARFGDLG